jgi:hypothetical protein
VGETENFLLFRFAGAASADDDAWMVEGKKSFAKVFFLAFFLGFREKFE